MWTKDSQGFINIASVDNLYCWVAMSCLEGGAQGSMPLIQVRAQTSPTSHPEASLTPCQLLPLFQHLTLITTGIFILSFFFLLTSILKIRFLRVMFATDPLGPRTEPGVLGQEQEGKWVVECGKEGSRLGSKVSCVRGGEVAPGSHRGFLGLF